MSIPNLYLPNLPESPRYQAHDTIDVLLHDCTETRTRWRTLTRPSGEKFQTRTVTFTDEAGRKVHLIQFREVRR